MLPFGGNEVVVVMGEEGFLLKGLIFLVKGEGVLFEFLTAAF